MLVRPSVYTWPEALFPCFVSLFQPQCHQLVSKFSLAQHTEESKINTLTIKTRD